MSLLYVYSQQCVSHIEGLRISKLMQGRTDSGLAGWWAGDPAFKEKRPHISISLCPQKAKMIAGMTLVMLFADFTKLSFQKVLNSIPTSNAADCLACHVLLHNPFYFLYHGFGHSRRRGVML